MIIIRNKLGLTAYLEGFPLKSYSRGFVPTMGYLHQGHLSMINQAKQDNSVVVVSLFVNPTQFNDVSDLKKYPRDLKGDLNKIETVCPNAIVFAPGILDIYERKMSSKKFESDAVDQTMEGKFRKGHFDGVRTIINIFFDLIRPHKAYFGEKDFQQLYVIQSLVRALNLDIEIVPCPTYRESHGLAMSSRNALLSEEKKINVGIIYETLKKARIRSKNYSIAKLKKWVWSEFSKHDFIKVEYVEITYEKDLKPLCKITTREPYRLFVAVIVDQVRLIDNISLIY